MSRNINEDCNSYNQTIYDYRLNIIEKQLLENQKEIDINQKELLVYLEKINTKFEEDHIMLIQHEEHLKTVDNKFNRNDKYMFMVISAVIAQLLVIISQIILPHLLH